MPGEFLDARLALAMGASVFLHLVILELVEAGRPGLPTGNPGALALEVSFKAILPEPRVPADPALSSQPAILAKAPPKPPPAPVPAAAQGEAAASNFSVPIPEARYFLSSELDVRAQPLQIETLVYPEKALVQRQHGRVQLRVFLSDTGKIDLIEVVSSDPPGVFEAAAIQALTKSTFAPAQKDGRNVRSQKLLEIHFDPYENLAGRE